MSATSPVESIGVSASDVTVQFVRGGQAIRPLEGFSFDAPAGSLVLLLGPSGCGKTTLLSCLAGILKPHSGRIEVNGSTVTSMDAQQMSDYRRTGVGIVFQAFNLVPSLDAVENVMVPLRAAGIPRREASARAIELLEHVGLSDRLRSKPGQLSGGQQQRVSIARALAMEPPLLLADEPTASLDHVQVETVLRILRSLADSGRTVIVSTHDPRLLGLADHVVDMVPLQAASTGGPEQRHLEAGEVLFEQGSRGDRIYRIDAGEVEIVDVGFDGTEHVVNVMQAGDEFGEMGAVFQLPRSATARAINHADVTGYTVSDFKSRFGVQHLMGLIARYAPGAAHAVGGGRDDQMTDSSRD
ncbi:MAG: putative glutamine-transport ATP-binding protein transporter [Ilumatobacteraceae bacterium]|nr:putative glutamine-transport ATP-binding protein transporter [Ilumatobacteraceae bacterium]